jgi:predicted MFS family arabinose efflux permease
MSGQEGVSSEERLITRPFVALGAATLAFFVAGGIVLPIAPVFARQELHADSLGVGVAIASFSIAALVMRPIVGWASDRFGRRPLLVGGSLLNVAALLLHLAATDLPLFIAARSLLGIAEGFYLVAAIAAGSDLAPPSRRGEAISFLTLSLYLGVATGPPIGEAVIGQASYPGVWLAAAFVAVVAVVLSWITPETVPDTDPDEPRRRRLIHPAGLFPGLIILLGLWGMAGFLTFLPLYARQIGLGGAGAPLALYALIVVALRVVGARIPDRYGAIRVSGGALALSAVGLTLIGLVPTAIGLIVGTCVFAAGVAFTMPALLTMTVARVPPAERGTVVGTTTVFLDLAFGLAPVGLGSIADRAGYGTTFLVSAVLAAAASVLLVAWGRSRASVPALST